MLYMLAQFESVSAKIMFLFKYNKDTIAIDDFLTHYTSQGNTGLT